MKKIEKIQKKCYTIDLMLSGMIFPLILLRLKMKLEKIKEKLIPILEKDNLEIYSIRTKKEHGEKIVEILLDVETIELGILEKIHLELVSKLDDQDLDPNHFLELSSLGIERPLKTKEELSKEIPNYIYLESPKYQGNATLLSFVNNVLVLRINDKGRFRKIEINYEDTKNIRKAVKF